MTEETTISVNNEAKISNVLYLCGEILTPCELKYTAYGEQFYGFTLKAKRLSGVADEIPVVISERLLVHPLEVGNRIAIKGQMRSYYKQNEKGIILMAFAQEVYEPADHDINEIELIGYISKEPTYRSTESGRQISDVILAVNRLFGKSDYLWVIFWGRNARYVSEMPIGTKLKLKGRVQSRNYFKTQENGTEETKTAYEVSVSLVSLMQK